MIVRPIRRLEKRPVGLVIHSGRVLGEWGITSVKDSPSNARLYAYRQHDLFREIQDGKGRGRYWRKRYVAFEIDGRKIYAMRDCLSRYVPEEAFCALVDWANWVRSNGANISSLASTSKSIWQSTLPRKIVLANNRLPMPRNDLIIGGRQEAKPGVYEEAELYDLTGAYQSAMRSMYVGRSYREVSLRHNLRLSGVEDCVGFVEAECFYPKNLLYGPLPIGLKHARFPATGRVEGIWDLEELRLAREVGIRVYPSRAWIGRGLRLPWQEWSDVITEGRSLPGGAGRMAKLMGNSLWGTFAVSGRGAWVHYEDGKAIVEMDKRETVASCRPLSAHVSAFVRVRLYREALAWFSAGPGVLAAHTDGVILETPFYPNGPIGDGLGEWRKKARMKNAVIITAQAYKYQDEITNENCYVVAGAPPEFAPQIFRRILASHEVRRQRRRLPGMLESTEREVTYAFE